jgi:uncharacterized protein HemX
MTTATPPPPVTPTTPAAAPSPAPPTSTGPAPKSRAWLGVLGGLVAVALLVGANAVLFLRVQDAQDRADEAITLTSGSQDQMQAQLDEIDASLARIEQDQQDQGDDANTLTNQVSALRKCVNNALDGFAQATQTGKPAAVTKC